MLREDKMEERGIIDIRKYTTGDFSDVRGRSLVTRTLPYQSFVQEMKAKSLFPFLRVHQGVNGTLAQVKDANGYLSQNALNFGSQDYLGLSKHSEVVSSAVEAIGLHGTHSAGSGAMGGGSKDAEALTGEMCQFLRCSHVLLFPTGWAAGYGIVRGLIRPTDHVVMDSLAHNCLQHGATASTKNVHLFRHNNSSSLEACLARIRKVDDDNAILVITEGLYSMDSDTPPLSDMQQLCHKYGATFMVDVAHDLGSMGPNGTGALGESGLLGKVDIVMGSFSKTFASIGGFLATNHASIFEYVRAYSGSYAFSNFLIPPQIASIRKALEIITSDEGCRLRERSLRLSKSLRKKLQEYGLTVLGRASPIILVLIGEEMKGRITHAILLRRGIITNLVEYPGVSRGQCRLRIQITPAHTCAQLTLLAAKIQDSLFEATDLSQNLANGSFTFLDLQNRLNAIAESRL